jgi:hypothetical protein
VTTPAVLHSKVTNTITNTARRWVMNWSGLQGGREQCSNWSALRGNSRSRTFGSGKA